MARKARARGIAIIAAGQLANGVCYLVAWVLALMAPAGDYNQNVLILFDWGFIALGGLNLLVGYGTWTLKRWSRRVGRGLAAFGVVTLVVGLASAPFTAFWGNFIGVFAAGTGIGPVWVLLLAIPYLYGLLDGLWLVLFVVVYFIGALFNIETFVYLKVPKAKTDREGKPADT
jgi:hypothetical protein